MKKNNIIEEIALDMGRSEKLMPDKCYVVSDDIILKKLEQVEDIEQTDRDGRTLLINAACYERKSAVEYLIKRKANVNARDNIGFTALHAAVQVGNVEIIKLLLENGADVNARNAYGNNPIMVTGHLLPKEVFKILMSYGADPNLKNDYGVSTIDTYAAYPDILSILNNHTK